MREAAPRNRISCPVWCKNGETQKNILVIMIAGLAAGAAGRIATKLRLRSEPSFVVISAEKVEVVEQSSADMADEEFNEAVQQKPCRL